MDIIFCFFPQRIAIDMLPAFGYHSIVPCVAPFNWRIFYEHIDAIKFLLEKADVLAVYEILHYFYECKGLIPKLSQ